METAPTLLVEDSPEDVMVLKRALRRIGFDEPVVHIDAGDAAIDHLREAPLPKLVLLDLNLPGLDGRDVLRWIRSETRFDDVPVAILTSSRNHSDVEFCLEHGANAYVVKPVGLAPLQDKIKTLLEAVAVGTPLAFPL